MGFEKPLLLILLALAPALLAVGLRPPWPALRLTLLPSADEPTRPWRVKLLWLAPALGAAAFAACVVAAAGPYRQARTMPDPRRARDIAIALDTSESMRAVDVEVDGRPASRLEASLRFAGAFIAGREGDRVGLIVFGGRAVTQCPLTFDREVARTLLSYVEPEALGKRTALGEAIALATARLPEGGALVLISDGRNTAGALTPLEAARAAAERKVRVYAIGVGSEGPAPVPARLPSGRVRMEYKRYELDEGALRGVAAGSGGAYFRATDAGALQAAFASIDRLEAHETPAVRRVPAGRLGQWAGLAAALALLAATVLSSAFLRTAPRLQ